MLRLREGRRIVQVSRALHTCRTIRRRRQFQPLTVRRRQDWSTTKTRHFCAANKDGGKDGDAASQLGLLPASLDPLGFKYFEPDILRARFDAYDTNDSGSIDVIEARQLLLDARFCQT